MTFPEHSGSHINGMKITRMNEIRAMDLFRANIGDSSHPHFNLCSGCAKIKQERDSGKMAFRIPIIM